MNDPACNICRFWAPTDESAAEPEKGLCRRHAPRPNPDAEGVMGAAWPATTRGDWCGEFIEKEKPKEQVRFGFGAVS